MDKPQKFELCHCGKIAQWIYMPGYSGGRSPYSCDDCVPRGCSCNSYSVNEEYYEPPTGEEDIDWQWCDPNGDPDINNKKEYYQNLDNGRPYPCCEYGWEKKDLSLKNMKNI
jgi:hypothetical protein